MFLSKTFLIIPLTLISICLAAESKHPNNFHPRTYVKLDDLDSFLIWIIGNFLGCPYKNLALVNQRLAEIYIKEFPYYKQVATQFDIPQLISEKSSRTSRDLGFFHHLKFVPDALTKFHLLHNHMFYHGNTFSANGKFIAWHLYKIYKAIPQEYKTDFDRERLFSEFMPNLVGLFIENSAYEALVDLFEQDFDEFVLGIKKFNLNDAKTFLQILGARGGVTEDSLSKLMKKLTFMNALFIYFPVDFYKPAVIGFDVRRIMRLLFNFLLNVPVTDVSYDIVYRRMYEFINEFLPEDRVSIFKRLAAIRFRPDIVNIDINLSYSSSYAFSVFVTASTAGRQNLLGQVLAVYRSDIIQVFKSQKNVVTIKAICDLLPYLTIEESQEFLNDTNEFFLRLLLSKMAVSEMKYDLYEWGTGSTRYLVTLRATEELIELGVPREITIRTNYREWYFLEHSTVIDQETLESFMRDYVNLPEFMSAMEAGDDLEEISPRIETILMMIKNPDMRHKIQSGEYRFKPLMNTDDGVVEVIKCFGDYWYDDLFISEDNNMHMIYTRSNRPAFFRNVERHFCLDGSFAEFINGSETEWNYGELRDLLFYLLQKEGGSEDLLLLEDTALLECLAKEAPEQVAALLNH